MKFWCCLLAVAAMTLAGIPSMAQGTSEQSRRGIFVDELPAELPPTTSEEALQEAVVGTLILTLLHELGHALVSELDLPVTGREEDVVDELAAYILIAGSQEAAAGTLNPAPPDRPLTGEVLDQSSGPFQIRRDEERIELLLPLLHGAETWRLMHELLQRGSIEKGQFPFWDEHGLSIQRYYNLLCVLYGSDPASYWPVIAQSGMDVGRARKCEHEFATKLKSWERLLGPHLRPESEPPPPDRPGFNIIYVKPKRPASLAWEAYFQKERFWRSLMTPIADGIVLPNDIDLRLVECGMWNAFWSPLERHLNICYGLIEGTREIHLIAAMQLHKQQQKAKAEAQPGAQSEGDQGTQPAGDGNPQQTPAPGLDPSLVGIWMAAARNDDGTKTVRAAFFRPDGSFLAITRHPDGREEMMAGTFTTPEPGKLAVDIKESAPPEFRPKQPSGPYEIRGDELHATWLIATQLFRSEAKPEQQAGPAQGGQPDQQQADATTPPDPRLVGSWEATFTWKDGSDGSEAAQFLADGRFSLLVQQPDGTTSRMHGRYRTPKPGNLEVEVMESTPATFRPKQPSGSYEIKEGELHADWLFTGELYRQQDGPTQDGPPLDGAGAQGEQDAASAKPQVAATVDPNLLGSWSHSGEIADGNRIRQTAVFRPDGSFKVEWRYRGGERYGLVEGRFHNPEVGRIVVHGVHSVPADFGPKKSSGTYRISDRMLEMSWLLYNSMFRDAGITPEQAAATPPETVLDEKLFGVWAGRILEGGGRETRFHVRFDPDGRFEIQQVGPDGQTSRKWGTHVTFGQTLRLVLEGSDPPGLGPKEQVGQYEIIGNTLRALDLTLYRQG